MNNIIMQAKEKLNKVIEKAKHADFLSLKDCYYDLVLYSMYINEKDLDDQIDFEKEVLRNNAIIEYKDRNGLPIEEEYQRKFEAQQHESKIRHLKDSRVRVRTMRILFKAVSLSIC